MKGLRSLILIVLVLMILLPSCVQSLPNIEQATSKDLGIEPLIQRKDTPMLCLGSCPLTGSHKWDNIHPDRGCEHDDKYCVVASIAMINHYYGGNISQDRITYYANGQKFHLEPEKDLAHGMGLSVNMATDALSWSLNGAEIYYQRLDITYDQIVEWINSNRPIMWVRYATAHYMVFDGYDGQYIHSINPWSGIEYRILYDDLNISLAWVPPADATARNDEPEIWMDSDDDGVVDFDEMNRFFTDPYNQDSDHDGILDKAEIISYTFLSDGSFDSEDVRKPDSDNDGLRAELDWDSDNGGAPDGIEDSNHNGFVDVGETDPLDPADDPPLEHPMATFNCEPELTCANEIIIFNASASYSPNGNIVYYKWDFGDGNTTITQEAIISYMYSEEGTYNVTLDIIDESYMRNSTSAIIIIMFRTDLNGDFEVNILDVSIVAFSFDSKSGDENWNQTADLDKNDVINIVDVSMVARDFGKTV